MHEALVFWLIGSIGGLLAGLLGIGGGVILIPLLVYWGNLPLKLATSVSMVFIIFASISGVIAHRFTGNINLSVGLWVGLSSVFGAFIGAFFSDILSDYYLQLIYLSVVVMAIIMLLLPIAEDCSLSDLEDNPSVIRRDYAVGVGLFKGMLTGMLGIGGGFITLPLMICVLKMGILSAVGTSLFATLFTGVAGLAGKILVSQFEVGPILWVTLGAVPAAQLGGWIAAKLKPQLLRLILLFLLLLIAVKVLYELF